jgi:glycosyltransferase involved in cell wall biosynthesis
MPRLSLEHAVTDPGNPIRVLFPYSGGDVVGGSHVSSLTLAAGFDRSRVAPAIVVHGAPGAVGRYVEDVGLEYRALSGPAVLAARYKRRDENASALGYLLRSVPAFVRFLRRERIDIVHTNEGGMHATWSLPAKLAGAKLVWHHRGAPDARGVNLLAPLLADRILSVSGFARPSRPVRDVSDRFEVLRSPFQSPAHRPDRILAGRALRAEIGAPADSVLLGYFGTLIARKRPDHFVRVVAAARAAMGGRPVHGLIFGREEVAGSGIAAACRGLAETLGVAGSIHFMGHRSPAAPLIAGIDVLAVTALGEPFGRTLIEAMDIGTPVVATRHGGNPEAIVDGESGFLVDPDSPEAFVPPIEALSQDRAMRDRLVAAAARFAGSLTTEAHVDRVTAIYEELAGSSFRRPRGAAAARDHAAATHEGRRGPQRGEIT